MHVKNINTVNVSIYISFCNELIAWDEPFMALPVLGLHVLLQRGLNKLWREMCKETSMETNSIINALTQWKQYQRTEYDFYYQ